MHMISPLFAFLESSSRIEMVIINYPLCVCVRYQRGKKALSRKRKDRGTFQKEFFLLSSAKSTPHPRAPPNPTTNLNATIITSHSSIHHALFSLSGSPASFLLSR